jgi:hypothetical protein
LPARRLDAAPASTDDAAVGRTQPMHFLMAHLRRFLPIGLVIAGLVVRSQGC